MMASPKTGRRNPGPDTQGLLLRHGVVLIRRLGVSSDGRRGGNRTLMGNVSTILIFSVTRAPAPSH